MSRFSPTTSPNAGEAFGRALQQSVGAYLQARQQKQSDEAEMLGRGYVPVDSSSPIKGPHTPPIVEPQAPAINQGALDTLVQKNTPQDVQAPTQAGQSFGAMLGAQAMPIQVAQSKPQPAGVSPQALSKAAGLDAYQPQDAQQPSPIHMLGRDWQMTPQALASMQASQAMARAELDNKNASTHQMLHGSQRSTPATFTLNGQTVQGSVDQEGRYYDGNGQPVQGPIGHYEKPNAVLAEKMPAKFTVNGQAVQGFADKQGNYYDGSGKIVSGATPYAPPRPAQQDHYSPLPGLDPVTKEPIVAPFDTRTGTVGKPLPIAPKPTAAAGKESAADKKERTYVDMMSQSVPTMEKLASKIRPDRISLALAHPTVGNYGLNQDEQTYLQAARNFLAGTLHQESGARLSAEQWAIGTQRFFPTAGDTPETIAQKTANARGTLADRTKALGSSSTPGTPRRDPGGDIDLGGDTAGKTITVNGKTFKVPN